jgi:GntR family transcriptional regulator, transcriptional repressor for pyruvate dehydrogenase complex
VPISTGTVALRPLKTSETVARDVVHDIVSGELGEGDRLPSEAQMLADYGVSRESLREGLRLLEVQGLITIRRGPGGGPVVGTVDPANLGRSASLYYHIAGATYDELFDAWVTAESLLAERAARHADRAEVRRFMDPYLVPLSEVGDAQLDEYVAATTQFHAVVASLADNRVLELLLSTIGQVVTHHVVVASDPREVADIVGPDHVEIAGAIRAGLPKKAGSLMAGHIGAIADFYRERMGPRVNDYVEWR